jgi:hypothetical protein
MILTWYQSTFLERNPYLKSIVGDRISIKYVGDLSRSINRRKKSKDKFWGNNCTEEELGFCNFTELYVGCTRNIHIHMWVSLVTIMYTWVVVGI